MTDTHAQRVQAYLDGRAELTERGANLTDQIAEAKNGGQPWARLTVTDIQGVLDELDAAQSSGDRAWGREHELLAEVDEARRIARRFHGMAWDSFDSPRSVFKQLGLDNLPDWLTAETSPAAPAVCGFELDDGSVAYYATGGTDA